MVGSGELGCELELSTVLDAIAAWVVEARIARPSMAVIRFTDEGPSISLFRTGNYQIRGAADKPALHRVNERFITVLDSIGVPVGEATFEVTNGVFLVDLGTSIPLERIIGPLGIAHVDYEPEQFAGLVYSRPESNVTLNIFASGKVVVLGATDRGTAERALGDVQEVITSLE